MYSRPNSVAEAAREFGTMPLAICVSAPGASSPHSVPAESSASSVCDKLGCVNVFR